MNENVQSPAPSLEGISIAEQKQAMLAAIIENSDDTILSKTLQGIITSWNRAAENMFGYTEAEVLGKHISLIIPPERLQEEAFIISEITKGNKVNHFQTIRIAKNGREVHISLTVSPILNAAGLIVGASKIARDISEQVAANEERERLYEQVRILNAKKDEFIGMASHELKTPLTSINGYLQIISSMVTEEKAKLFISKTRSQVKKLNTLVSDLLDVSKIEAGKLRMNVSDFDLYLVIKDVIELLAYGSNKHYITLETNVAELFVNADSNRIEQVIINLLTNAIRYAPGKYEINIYLQKDATDVKVGIRDYGVGIVPEKLNDIFSRFYRVDDNNPNISGLGIGLYLSKEIILRHNGKIWAESEVGVGSTFWFTLPLGEQ
jgi:PAS domain S-box-containing protein